MQEKIDEKGTDTPDNYKAVAISDFIQHVYEGLAMNDDKMPSFDAVKGHINTDLILEDAKLNRGFERFTETEVAAQPVITGDTPLGVGGDPTKSLYEDAVNKAAQFDWAGGLSPKDRLNEVGIGIKEALVQQHIQLGLPADYLKGVKFSANGSYLTFTLPEIKIGNVTIESDKISVAWKGRSEASLNDFANKVLAHMYPASDAYTQRTGGQTTRGTGCPKGQKPGLVDGGPGGTKIPGCVPA